MWRMTVHNLGIAIVVSLAGCLPPPPPQSPAVFVSANASINDSPEEQQLAPPGAAPAASWSAVQVLVDKRVGRPTEVVGVLDFHSNAASEDKGFDELRARAAAMGADAVIGAEFEHGEGNEPSHLSGMAVRFLDR
jgi:hypothetical protein